MLLQQTKRGSRKSGGPQYYLHDLTEPVKVYLRKKGAVRVALVTPYGPTKSDYFAVSKDHYKYADSVKSREINRVERPLTFTREYVSAFWKDQISDIENKKSGTTIWSLAEICRIVKDHSPTSKVPHILEPDILSASGPLKHFGMALGPYVGKGYDCVTDFSFLQYPTYRVPIEIKRLSKEL